VPKHSLEFIFENDDFVAVNKPSGLLSIPSSEGKEASLKEQLKEKYGSIFTVHRLDKETSGAIIFAKNTTAHKFLSLEFENRRVKKIYRGIASGLLSVKKGTIDLPIQNHSAKRNLMIVHAKGKQSVTDYSVLEEFGLFSFVEFQIHTGRTHQIRVHMQHLGHPIVCDELYGNAGPVYISSFKRKFKLSKSSDQERPILSRLALHSLSIDFRDLIGKENTVVAEMPKDLRAFMQQMKKWSK
jgi:23S rRNA pseudouridine1911/1915/1917 synthase